MIKKSLRAYITCRQLKLLILPHGKVFRLAFFQRFKHQIDGILEILVVLPDLHRVNHADQHRKVAIFRWSNVIQIADQGGIEQRFRLLMIGKALK